jgi:thiol-disulfide isomerase/thioredoxin
MRFVRVLALIAIAGAFAGCKQDTVADMKPGDSKSIEATVPVDQNATTPTPDGKTDPSSSPSTESVAASMEEPSPIPLGKPAPDFQVASLTGDKLKLSSLKGKVVMIDFWATWCPPCREGLPITNKMHEKYSKQGLQVLTVSNEDAITVSDFIKENKYSFPAYLDTSGSAESTYKIEGIPTLVVIDAQGNLSSYMVGLHPEEAVVAALKKAGLKV